MCETVAAGHTSKVARPRQSEGEGERGRGECGGGVYVRVSMKETAAAIQDACQKSSSRRAMAAVTGKSKQQQQQHPTHHQCNRFVPCDPLSPLPSFYSKCPSKCACLCHLDSKEDTTPNGTLLNLSVSFWSITVTAVVMVMVMVSSFTCYIQINVQQCLSDRAQNPIKKF